MKCALLLLAALMLTVDGARKAPARIQLTDADVDNILKSERLFNNYIKCVLDKGRCSPDGKEIKRRMAEQLPDGKCERCTAKDKHQLNKVLLHLITKKPETYKEIEQKYDPSGSYLKNNREAIYSAVVLIFDS